MQRRFSLVASVALAAVLAGLLVHAAGAPPQQQHPDVLSATVRPRGGDSFDFDVTVSSRYDTAERYADAFRVMSASGAVYGERTLFHDHADEQPFARDLYGVKVPRGVRSVVVQGRDKQFGWGGKTVTVILPGR